MEKIETAPNMCATCAQCLSEEINDGFFGRESVCFCGIPRNKTYDGIGQGEATIKFVFEVIYNTGTRLPYCPLQTKRR
jgi:hypothetical protein